MAVCGRPPKAEDASGEAAVRIINGRPGFPKRAKEANFKGGREANTQPISQRSEERRKDAGISSAAC
jgi:hypothetical protein